MPESHYPPRHHPIFFLQDALADLGVDAEFNNRDDRTHGMWGLIIDGKPMVWLVDNRWLHERKTMDPAAKQLLQEGALVCHAQRPDAERVGGYWLPLAVTPGYDADVEQKIDFEVAFVGYMRDMTRVGLLADVASRFRTSFGSGLFGNDAISTYFGAHVGLNIPTRYGDPNCYDVNMRVFEIAGLGRALVTNHVPELEALGLQGVTYTDKRGVIPAIREALEHATDIGEHNKRITQEKHLYRHRAEQVVQWFRD